MGICISYESISTAKLIHQDGRLQEFSDPVKVSQILKENPKCFICSSGDMDVNASLSAIDADHELEPGELYFSLPLTWLNSPLRPDRMAALAVKASLALEGCRPKTAGGCAGGCCGMGFIRRLDPLLFTPINSDHDHKAVECCNSTTKADYVMGIGSYGGAGGGGFTFGGRGKRRGFTKLTAILEEA